MGLAAEARWTLQSLRLALRTTRATIRACTNKLFMKTVTLDEIAYARLKAWKRGGRESFSSVIKRLVPEPGTQRVAEAQGDNTPLTRADLAVFELRSAARDRVSAAKLPQAAKDRASQLAREVEGVKNVTNNLKVG